MIRQFLSLVPGFGFALLLVALRASHH